jgi:asparagine synthase (glutamine-hydrolysing)
MCGITGFIDFNKKSDLSILTKMTDVLSHRGPDDSGYFFVESDIANIGLGHRRLSILDLSKHGHQPMRFENLEIVYNGEVYNFWDIRLELEKYGYVFKSNSDTEVILKAFHKWGMKSIDQFIGMFAIALHDNRTNRLYLIRDRAGVKPIYWYWKNNLFMFASELKSFHQNKWFHKEISSDSLALFFQLAYVPQPWSIFKNTKKVRAGHFLEFNLKNKQFTEKKYWDVLHFYNKPKKDIPESEAMKEIEKKFQSAFRYRNIADVPVGIFLSGGYDSSIVAAILQRSQNEKVKTFTIGFNDINYDEAPFANKVADFLGTDHTQVYCTWKEALDIIPDLPVIYDEPFADHSAIPTILVSKIARKTVSVALSADGGDEIFGGYDKYMTKFNKYTNIFKYLRKIIGSKNLNRLSLFIQQHGFVKDDLFANKVAKFVFENNIEIQKIISYFSTPIMNERIISDYSYHKIQTCFDDIQHVFDNNVINKMLAIDYKTYLVDDILHKVDRATMSVSLEGREPFLDHRIIEYMAQLPDHYKILGNEKKYLLKKITHQLLPTQLMDRPKMGFSIPLKYWLNNELQDYISTYFSSKYESVINRHALVKIKKLFYQKRINYRFIWNILIFQMWYQKWI